MSALIARQAPSAAERLAAQKALLEFLIAGSI